MGDARELAKLGIKIGDEVVIAVTRLASWDTNGRERCIVKVNDDQQEYYGVTTVDDEEGIRYVYVPKLDTTFNLKVENA